MEKDTRHRIALHIRSIYLLLLQPERLMNFYVKRSFFFCQLKTQVTRRPSITDHNSVRQNTAVNLNQIELNGDKTLINDQITELNSI